MVTKMNFIREMRNRGIKQERLEVPEFLCRQEEKKKAVILWIAFWKAGTLEPENKQSSTHWSTQSMQVLGPGIVRACVMSEVGALVQML